MRETVTIVAIAAVLVGLVRSSDVASDKRECNNQLLPLSSCMSFVSGESDSPSPLCCAILHTKINSTSTKKCLCALVNDRNDPALGLKIIPSNALSLPSLCFIRSNASQCIDLLGLAPNSPEALVFSMFQRQFNGFSSGGSTSKIQSRWIRRGESEAFEVWCWMLTITSTLLLNLSWVYDL